MKIGMIGIDTSHCPAFTRLLNDESDRFHVPGGKVVIGFPGGSPTLPQSYERVDKFTAQLKEEFGVKIADSIEEVAEGSDAILLESVDGRQHLEQFAKIAPYGKPVFIDKPIATSKRETEEIFALAERHGAPVFSSSALRYAAGLYELGAGEEILGCETFGPAAVLDDFPALYWYGVHSAETLFAKMGTGCRRVQVNMTEKVDMVTGIWEDGRVGTLYGHRFKGASAFGATVFTPGGVRHALAGNEPPYYALLLERVMEFFKTGRPPVEPAETVEIAAFLEAANKSRLTGEAVAL